MRTVFLLVCTFAFCHAFGQHSLKLRGKVFDEQTNQPLPFVNILYWNGKLGVSTNQEGEFEIPVHQLPIQLRFSFVGYDKKVLVVAHDTSYLEVSLAPAAILLAEVVINGQRDNRYVQNLVLNAYKKASKLLTNKSFAKAFYRQITRNDSTFSEVYEIFYHAQVSRRGIDQWQIEQGRYAISRDHQEKDYVSTLNFTLLSESFTMFGESGGEAFISPVNRFTLKRYNFSISKILETDGRRIAIVEFVPGTQLKKPALSGQVWIDIDNYDMLRMKGELKDPKLKLIDVTGPKSRWSNYQRKYDIAFKTIKDTILVPDYFKIEHSMNYAYKNKFKRKISTSSALTFYEYTDSLNIDKYIHQGKEDMEKIQALDYNHQFWQENSYIFRTPLEEKIIRSLQKNGAVGTLFNNLDGK